MSKPIEIRLSDAQCAALAAEAEAAGLKFFDHCRAKLLANMTTPAPESYGRSPAMQALPRLKRDNARVSAEIRQVERREALILPPAPSIEEVDRIGRLEVMMQQVVQTITGLASLPQAHAPDQVQEEYDPNLDIDDVVNASLGEAERQGLTVVDRGAAPAAAGGVRHVGTMPPRPFSPATQPRHLQGLGG